MEHVVITGADRGIGFALAEIFAKKGFAVYAGQYMPEWKQLEELCQRFPKNVNIIPLHIEDDMSVKEAARIVGTMTKRVDILVNCAGIFPTVDDREHFLNAFRVNTLGSMRMVENFLPLMQEGRKRICIFSSEAGSISLAHRTGNFAYCVSKTALNMASQMMFQELRPQGYTFRLYHPGWVKTYMLGFKGTEGNFEPEESAQAAYEQFVSDAECEDILVMRDVRGEYWPF